MNLLVTQDNEPSTNQALFLHKPLADLLLDSPRRPAQQEN
jgi:hypothetical protein